MGSLVGNTTDFGVWLTPSNQRQKPKFLSSFQSVWNQVYDVRCKTGNVVIIAKITTASRILIKSEKNIWAHQGNKIRLITPSRVLPMIFILLAHFKCASSFQIYHTSHFIQEQNTPHIFMKNKASLQKSESWKITWNILSSKDLLTAYVMCRTEQKNSFITLSS